MTGPVVVVGDLLLDREVLGAVERLCPEAPVPVLSEQSTVDRPGGAGLSALFLTEELAGSEVVVVAAVSQDEPGDRLAELLAEAGVRLAWLPRRGPTPEKIRMRAGEHLLMRLDRGDGESRVGPPPAETLAAIASARAVLVSDYGRGTASQPDIRAALADRARRVPLVWDPHPRGGPPVPGARLVTPNRGEAAAFLASTSLSADAAGAAVQLRRSWAANAVAVTLGDRGAVVSAGFRAPVPVPAPFAARGDPCGAGDRFASAAVAALADEVEVVDAVRVAVGAATAYVAAGGALALVRGSAPTFPGRWPGNTELYDATR
jgi:rfaE bifunctional protein kinase chain/domain